MLKTMLKSDFTFLVDFLRSIFYQPKDFGPSNRRNFSKKPQSGYTACKILIMYDDGYGHNLHLGDKLVKSVSTKLHVPF